MKLTIDDALHKAVEAHKAGKVREADRLYTAILKAQPEHADANHNMGVLAVGVEKVEAALPFFKAALEANPRIGQFWLSYIDALIKLDRIDDAKIVIDQAKTHVAQSDNLKKLEEKLTSLEVSFSEKLRKTSPNQPNILDTINLNQAIKLATKSVQAGSIDEAKRIYQDILVKFPKNKKAIEGVNTLSKLATSDLKAKALEDLPQIYLQELSNLHARGQLVQALQRCEDLVRQYPKSATLFNIKGAVLAGLGHLDLSIEAYKTAVSITPDYASAHYNMGNVFKDLKKPNEAIQAFIQALSIKPDLAEASNNLGNILKEEGRLDEAVEAYKKAVSSKPSYPESYNNMGVALKDLGKAEEAIETFKKAISIKPDYAEAYSNMGVALTIFGQQDEAIEALTKAISLKPDHHEAYVNMGNTLKDQNKLKEAIAAYEIALSINPNFPDAYNNMGNVFNDQGKVDDAINAFSKALQLDPNHASAHRNISMCKKYTPTDPQIKQVAALLQKKSLCESDRCHLLYTQAKIHEDLGNYDAAFNFFVSGGNIRRQLLGYNIAQDQYIFDKIKTAAPQFQDFCNYERHSPISPLPIFILGMPRSGTSLIEQILSSHSEITGGGELSYAAQFGAKFAFGQCVCDLKTINLFREQYLLELEKRSRGQRFVTDKSPLNFRLIGLLCAAFPEARIIHVKRDAAATCWSNFKNYFSSAGLGYSYNLEDTVQYYGLYSELMEYWQQNYKGRIYNLDYDCLTEKQELETRRLIDYLQLPWEDTCLFPEKNARSVSTASKIQIRERVYQRSSQKWRIYEPFLDNLFSSLQNKSV